VIAYFGEVIKMCANITYLMMTLNRYLLVGKDHAPWLVTIAKLEFKWVIRGSLIFTAMINIGHGWQYQAVEDTAITLFYTNTEYGYENGHSFSDYPSANQGQPYFIYSIVYFVINFCFFFILNTGIEVKLVRRMHKELKEKRERLAKMNADKPSASSADSHKTPEPVQDKKKEEEDAKKELKVIKMVMLNGFFNFVLRAPEILFWMENQSVWSIFNNRNINVAGNHSVPGFLSMIADIGFLTYILTFSSNFVIFYKFNKNFKEAVVFFQRTSTNSN
jgi:hypothetical protein